MAANPPAPTAIREWHICITGFLQGKARPVGLHRIWRQIKAERSAADVEVPLLEWNANWAAWADFILAWRNCTTPRVFIYGYSWGAGYGAQQLSRELMKRSMVVEHQVLCDPVYRSPLISTRWRAMLRRQKIRVPQNVRKVTWGRQFFSRPGGHDLVSRTENPALYDFTTVIGLPKYLDATHVFADEHPWFERVCIEVARGAGVHNAKEE